MSSDPKLNLPLGQKIKALRAEQGITRERLAEQVGVSARFLADVEAGKVGLSLPTPVNLCRALGTSADYLLGLTGEPSPWEELGPACGRPTPGICPDCGRSSRLIWRR